MTIDLAAPDPAPPPRSLRDRYLEALVLTIEHADVIDETCAAWFTDVCDRIERLLNETPR